MSENVWEMDALSSDATDLALGEDFTESVLDGREAFDASEIMENLSATEIFSWSRSISTCVPTSCIPGNFDKYWP